MLWPGVVFILLLFDLSHEVKIKIVDEPFSIHGSFNAQHSAPKQVDIVARVDPQPLSGPPHLQVLKGKCFQFTKDSYRYEFCPFQNVTQREVTHRWNAFHGVLGVWKEWTIVNKTFEAMHMTAGDICVGQVDREIKVFPQCGEREEIISVSEPVTCKYEMIFKTPWVCPVDALAVYPVLSKKGQEEFERIEDELYYEEITLQGYNKERKKLFISEGLWIDPDKPSSTEKKNDTPPPRQNTEATGKPERKANYDLLNSPKDDIGKTQCLEEYVKLLDEVKKLRALLKKATSSSGKPNLSELTVEPFMSDSDRAENAGTNKEMMDKGTHSSKQTHSNLEQLDIKNIMKNSENKIISETDSLRLKFDVKSAANNTKELTKQSKGKKGDEGLLIDIKNATYHKDMKLWFKKYSENVRERMKLHAWIRSADNL